MTNDEVLQYIREFGDNTDISAEEKAKIVAAIVYGQKEKSQMHYRINGVRRLFGGRINEIRLPTRLQKVHFSGSCLENLRKDLKFFCFIF